MPLGFGVKMLDLEILPYFDFVASGGIHVSQTHVYLCPQMGYSGIKFCLVSYNSLDNVNLDHGKTETSTFGTLSHDTLVGGLNRDLCIKNNRFELCSVATKSFD